MLKKELKDASRSMAECLPVLLVIPLIDGFVEKMFVDLRWEFPGILGLSIYLIAMVYSVYAGLTIFRSERRDGALEYMLSLPLSKVRILTNKLLPRILFLAFSLVIYMVSSGAKEALPLGFLMLVLLVISTSLSLAIDSVVIGFIGVGLLFQVFRLISEIIYYFLSKGNSDQAIQYSSKTGFFSQMAAAALLLIPFGLAFWLIFNNLDHKPIKYQLKPYYYIALPCLITLIITIIFYFKVYLAWYAVRG